MADGSLIFDTRVDSSGLERGLSGVGGIAKSAFGVATKAVAAVTGALVAGAGAAIKVGSSFESGMSQVAATMGFTAEEIANGNKEFERLEDAAKNAGKTTQFSATQAAEALNYMALAGYDVDKSIQTLPTVLNLAAAGGMDLAAASNMVTNSMNSLGEMAGTTESFVDKMAKTSQKSGTTVQELGDAILTVGGTAKNLAGGVDEMNTVLGIFADNGVKGSEGGTALRNVILSLSAPTDVAKKKMQELGLEVFDADGNMRPLNDTFNDLNEILGTMNGKERTEVLNKIFNKVDLTSVNALLANSGERFNELSGYIADCDGAAANMAETMNDNLKGKITTLKSALEGLGIEIYESMKEPLKDAAETGISIIGELTDAFTEGGPEGFAKALGGILADLVMRVQEFAPHLIELAMNLIKALLSGMTQNIQAVLDRGANIVTTLIDGISSMLPEIIELAVEIIRSFLSTLVENAPTIIKAALSVVTTLIDGILSMLPDIIELGLEIIVSLALGIVEYVPKLIPTIIDVILRIVDTIVNNIDKIVEAAAQIVEGLIDGLIGAIPQLLDGAVKLLMALIDAIPVIIDALVENIPTIIRAVVDALTEGLPMLLDAAIELFMALVDALPQIMENLKEAFPKIITTVLNALIEAIPDLLAAAIVFFMAIVQAIPEIIGALLEALPEIQMTILETLGTLAESLWTDVLIPAIDRFLEWGAEVVENGKQAASDFVQNVIDFIKELPGKTGYWLNHAIFTVIKWVWDMTIKAKEAGKEFVQNVIDFIKNLPSRIYTWLQNTISKVLSFKTDMKTKAKEAGKGFFDNIVDGIKELPEKVKEIGANIVSGIWEGISSGWGWLLGEVKNLANSLFQGAKDALDIHSPSRKFKWLGEMCVEGLDEPIADYNPYGTLKASMQADAGIMKASFMNGAMKANFRNEAGIAAQAPVTGNTTQNINIYQPVKSPSEMARAVRLEQQYGLAGA